MRSKPPTDLPGSTTAATFSLLMSCRKTCRDSARWRGSTRLNPQQDGERLRALDYGCRCCQVSWTALESGQWVRPEPCGRCSTRLQGRGRNMCLLFLASIPLRASIRLALGSHGRLCKACFLRTEPLAIWRKIDPEPLLRSWVDVGCLIQPADSLIILYRSCSLSSNRVLYSSLIATLHGYVDRFQLQCRRPRSKHRPSRSWFFVFQLSSSLLAHSVIVLHSPRPPLSRPSSPQTCLAFMAGVLTSWLDITALLRATGDRYGDDEGTSAVQPGSKPPFSQQKPAFSMLIRAGWLRPRRCTSWHWREERKHGALSMGPWAYIHTLHRRQLGQPLKSFSVVLSSAMIIYQFLSVLQALMVNLIRRNRAKTRLVRGVNLALTTMPVDMKYS